MLRRSCVGWLVGSLAVAVGTWSPTELHAGGGKHASPFRGSAVGRITEVVPPNQLVLEASGTATHLGRFTRVERLFLNPDGFSFTGTIVFTSASGAELWADVDGQFTSPSTAVGSYQFTGGTGRFHCASGTARFMAEVDAQGQVTVSFNGSIRY